MAIVNIARAFAKTFEHWNIEIPAHDLAKRKPGKIVEAGWSIWYLFGSNEKGEYLDYYASHRMTDDRHVRVHANGEEEDLPVLSEFYVSSDDPAEDKRRRDEYYAENQRTEKILKEKGFGLAGDEPGRVQINRVLKVKKGFG